MWHRDKQGNQKWCFHPPLRGRGPVQPVFGCPLQVDHLHLPRGRAFRQHGRHAHGGKDAQREYVEGLAKI